MNKFIFGIDLILLVFCSLYLFLSICEPNKIANDEEISKSPDNDIYRKVRDSETSNPEVIPEKLNVVKPLSAYFNVHSDDTKDLSGNDIKDLWRFRSRNFPQKIMQEQETPESQVFILVKETTKLFDKKYEAMEIVLGNTTSKEVCFVVQAGRLSMVQEAQDENGEWKPIERLQFSWCGNSYHTRGLKPGYMWCLIAPRYIGSFETQLRIKLIHNKDVIYSKAFPGSINKEQFNSS